MSHIIFIQVLGGASSAVTKVKGYVEQVEAKLEELRNCPKTLVKKNQDAIEKIFGIAFIDCYNNLFYFFFLF